MTSRLFASRSKPGSCREQPLLPINRKNACLHLNLIAPHRRKSANGNFAGFLENPDQFSLGIYLGTCRQMFDRSQHFNEFQIVSSCNNCQCALARCWNEIVNRQPFRNSLSHTELCQPSLSKYDRVELSLVQSLHPSLHVSK